MNTVVYGLQNHNPYTMFCAYNTGLDCTTIPGHYKNFAIYQVKSRVITLHLGHSFNSYNLGKLLNHGENKEYRGVEKG